MKKWWTFLVVALMAWGMLDEALAAPGRLGGGKSIGRQSSNVTQREAQSPARPNQAAPAQPSQAQQAAPGAAAQQPARSRWGGMLGGLAAGLGLAWLAHSLGFGEGFAQFLLLALVAVAVLAFIGAMRARRTAPAQGAAGGYSYAPASAMPQSAPPLPQYNPEKVGNDASARPWERSSMAFDAAKYGGSGANAGVRIGSALQGSQNWGVPAGFDNEGFLAAAKRNFVTLQDAWDHADLKTLRSMMTDEMLGEIRSQLAERATRGEAASRTEVVMLDAQLLGIEEMESEYLASVEFSGMLREDPSAGPSPFREVWNMVRPKNGSTGWLVAGVQALQ